MKYSDKTGKKIKKAAFVFILLSVVFAFTEAYADGEGFYEPNPNMLIGLIYGGGAVESFQTSSDTGFLFGYVGRGASDKFTVLSYSASKKIKVSRGKSNDTLIVANPDTGEVLLEYPGGGNYFAAAAATESNKNTAPGQAITALSAENTGFTATPAGNINFGAFIYRMTGGGRVEVINLISLEDYIKGVIPYEISPDWPDEALKAFSVTVRSYSLSSAGRHADAGFMLCNSTHCQFYAGSRRATEKSNAAADATKGAALVYDGQIAEAVYHSSSGGVTENHNDAWGGDARLPYLSSVAVPHERYAEPGRANSLWVNTVSPKGLYDYLVGESPQAPGFKGRLNSEIASITVNGRSPVSNYIKSATVTDKNGNSVTLQNSDVIRSAFGKYANSANMDIYKASKFKSFMLAGGGNTAVGRDIEPGATHILTANGVVKSTPGDGALYVLAAGGKYSVRAYAAGGDFVFDGRGWGHGVGLSQWGMHDMAEAGMKYEEILKAFYTGVSMEKITDVEK